MKKVKTVRINKKEMMRQNFRKKGLSEILSEVNFPMVEDIRPSMMMKKLLQAVRRSVRRDFMELTPEEKKSYIKQVDIHPFYSVEINSMSFSDSHEKHKRFYAYLQSLLYQSLEKKDREKVKKSDLEVMEVKIKNGEAEVYKGYTVLEGKVRDSIHRSSVRLTNNFGYAHHRVLDMCTLIAETLIIQSMVKFSTENIMLTRYVYFKEHIKIPDTAIPTGELESYLKKEVAKNESKLLQHQDIYLYGIYHASCREEKFVKIYDRDICFDYLLQLVVEEFIRHVTGIKEKTTAEYKERSEYAKAFQTKKNIKQTHLEKMKNNAFLSKYGEVELDNDVDLEKFSIVEESFKELCENFPVPSSKDYQFRIKKLGKHRAAGIFFPYHRNTIFDLNHPDSYVHELFHQIDHMLADGLFEDYYSETLTFRPLFDEYKKIVRKAVYQLPKSHPLKTEWEGSSKFNQAYYFKPTEVFARCGEIYMAKKGIDNSLLKTQKELEESSVVYPLYDENFVEKICIFYENLEQKIMERFPESLLKEEVKEVTKEEMIPSFLEDDVSIEVTDTEQISLF